MQITKLIESNTINLSFNGKNRSVLLSITNKHQIEVSEMFNPMRLMFDNYANNVNEIISKFFDFYINQYVVKENGLAFDYYIDDHRIYRVFWEYSKCNRYCNVVCIVYIDAFTKDFDIHELMMKLNDLNIEDYLEGFELHKTKAEI